jgi:serine/threonine-protein kinase
MPFVEGESLRAKLARERQLPLDEALRITREAGQGLQYAHEHGVVHRDVKPENLLLTTDGNTLVADFGIARALQPDAGDARLTETGMAVGTPAYMSPEQASGDKSIDARTDVYSLAAVLYEMLAGEPPFAGSRSPRRACGVCGRRRRRQWTRRSGTRWRRFPPIASPPWRSLPRRSRAPRRSRLLPLLCPPPPLSPCHHRRT